MGAGFTKTLKQYPGDAAVAAIEGTVVIDENPPIVPLGVALGTLVLVGEFDSGALARPVEVFGGADIEAKFGSFGFSTSTSPHDGTVARQSGGNEPWNGNGFIWLGGNKYSRMVLCRVDNSAGSVAFSRLACLTSTKKGPFSSADADSLTITLNAGTVTPQTDGTKGQQDASGASFPVVVTGLTLEVKVDAQASKIITFTAAQTTITNVVDHINATLAQTVASDNSGQLRLSSVIAGANGRIEILSGTARTILGYPTAAVAQLSTYTVNAQSNGVYTMRVQKLVNGLLVNFDTAPHTSSAQTTTQLRDSLLAALQLLPLTDITFAPSASVVITATADLNITFTPTVLAEPTASDVTIAATTPAVLTISVGTGNVGNLASYTSAEMVTVIDALTNVSAEVDADGFMRVCNTQTPATGTIQMTGGALLTPLGFDNVTIDNAALGDDLTVPFGTQVSDGTTVWVTLESFDTGTTGGPFAAKVRPFSDDDTAVASGIGTITTVVSALLDGFSVTNAAAVTRLSAPQLDAAYATALDATLDLNTPAGLADFVASARTSDAIMAKLVSNADTATQDGLRPRKCFLRPLIGTTIAAASGSTGSGVGVSRNDRAQYCFPGVTTLVPEIQTVGIAGGTGFTVDGIIQVGADRFVASAAAVLAPEENLGQDLRDTNVGRLRIVALEDAHNSDKGGIGLTVPTYTALKASGITAPRVDSESGPLFHSDVTSSLTAALVDGSRRRMADFIIASVSGIAGPYIKKLGTPRRIQALGSSLRDFLTSLLSESQPDLQRIVGYSVIEDTSSAQRENGIVSFSIKVKTIAAMKNIVLRVQVGTGVTIDQVA